MDAKIFPNDVRYAIKVIKYVIPDSTQEVYDLKDDKLTKTDFQTIYEDNKYNEADCLLQLVKIEDDQQRITTIREVRIEDATDIQICFSPDGMYFALFKKAYNYLYIYSLDNIDDLIEKVENQDCLRVLAQVDTLKDAQKLRFDRNNRYLISYGETRINIIDLLDKEEHPFHVLIDEEQFDRIVDLQFVSQSHGNYRCDLMCQNVQRQIIQVCKLECLDFDPSPKPKVEENKYLSYLNMDCSELQIKMSDDFESIMMTNGNENYCFGRENDEGEHYYQRGITRINNKNLNYILPSGHDFYFITSKDFDNNVKV